MEREHVDPTVRIQKWDIWMVTYMDGEEERIRPMLVVSNDVFNALGNSVTAVPLCRPRNKKAIPTHVALYADGLRFVSIAKCESMKNIGKKYFKVKVAEIKDTKTKSRIDTALFNHLAIGNYRRGEGE